MQWYDDVQGWCRPLSWRSIARCLSLCFYMPLFLIKHMQKHTQRGTWAQTDWFIRPPNTPTSQCPSSEGLLSTIKLSVAYEWRYNWMGHARGVKHGARSFYTAAFNMGARAGWRVPICSPHTSLSLLPCAGITGLHCSNKCLSITTLASSRHLAASRLSCPPTYPGAGGGGADCAKGKSSGSRPERGGGGVIYILQLKRHSSDLKAIKGH